MSIVYGICLNSSLVVQIINCARNPCLCTEIIVCSVTNQLTQCCTLPCRRMNYANCLLYHVRVTVIEQARFGLFAVEHYEHEDASPLLDRQFCERSILCFTHVSFSPTYFFRRLQTDIFETFPHDVALLEKEALLCRFPKSAP